MKNKAEKCIKIIIWILSSVIIGCLLNYYVTSEILATYFYGLASVYPILTIVVLIMQIIVIVGVIYMIYKKDCPRYIMVLGTILYIVVMAILLFGRSNSERIVNLNIMELFSKDAFMQNILNFIFFIPIGYLLRKKKLPFLLICAFIIVLGIEGIQLITARGIFDIVDIVVDLCAIILGYGVFRKISLRNIDQN